MSDPHTRQMMTAVIDLQKEHLENAERLQGQEPTESMKLTRERLLEAFAEPAKVSHSSGIITPSGQTLIITYLGKPYAPCVVAISDLEPISLSELRLETHHRGRVLIVKTFCKPKRAAAVINAIEDQNGDVSSIALYNIPSNIPIREILPGDTFFAVKEPYFTPNIDGKVQIRVDHPSNLIRLEMDSSFIPLSMVQIPIEIPSPMETKESGNAASKRGDWQIAIRCYTKGLGLKQHDDNLRRALRLNRSVAHINLGHYELAVQDALTVLLHGDILPYEYKVQKLKALCYAGRAAYELGDFVNAKQYFASAQCLEVPAAAGDVLAELHRTEERLKEEITGEYNFEAMSNSATKDHTNLDHASFLTNTKTASAGHRGRGLFVTKDFAPGEVIMVEKAFYIASDRDDTKEIPVIVNMEDTRPLPCRGKYAERVYGIIDKILHNTNQAARFLDLHDGGRFRNKASNFVDGMVTVNIFLVESIVRLNGFGCPRIKSTYKDEPDGGDDSNATGIWLHASHANHSCIPNADRSFIGDMMIVRATRDIKSGEEIFMCYCSSDDSYAERKEHLSSYGFECDCPLCELEKHIPLAVFNKRARLLDETNQFITTRMATADLSTLPADTVSNAEQLLQQLEDTYPEGQYRHLPRLECVPFSYWLCLVHGTPEQKLKRTLRGLRNHGYFIEMKINGVAIDRSSAVPLAPAMIITLLATAACLQSGKVEAARQLQQLRKEIYTILYACDDGFDDMDSQFGG